MENLQKKKNKQRNKQTSKQTKTQTKKQTNENKQTTQKQKKKEKTKQNKTKNKTKQNKNKNGFGDILKKFDGTRTFVTHSVCLLNAMPKIDTLSAVENQTQVFWNWIPW